jgi:hypothetical protein
MNDTATMFRGGRTALGVSIGLAALGSAALVVGFAVETKETLYAYLAAYDYVVSTVLGALVFLMIAHAMRAGWPVLLRRLVEGVVATLPLLAVLYLPLLLGLRTLYPWLRPETIADAHARDLVLAKAPYLDRAWFLGRAAVYYALWIFVAALLRRWSLAKDRDPAAKVEDRMYAFSGALLPVVALSLSFAAIDWLMTLTPTWFSSMFPVYSFAGGFLASIALLTLLAFWADRSGAIRGIQQAHYYALGRLLLAFVVFWGYVAYFQFMLIWIANKPDEVTYFLDRSRGGWLPLTVVLVIAQFVAPFLALLSYGLKRRRGPLAAVAVWLLAAHYLDVHWLVAPIARPHGPVYAWVDLAALLAIGGSTFAFAWVRMRGLRTVPVHDARLSQALRYESR